MLGLRLGVTRISLSPQHLSQAAVEGRVDEISVLLCHGLDVNAVNKEGDTALHLASRHGQKEVVQRLADAFPNETIENNRGLKALDEAAQADYTQCAAFIQSFIDDGKVQALQEHCRFETKRLRNMNRTKVFQRGLVFDRTRPLWMSAC